MLLRSSYNTTTLESAHECHQKFTYELEYLLKREERYGGLTSQTSR